MLSDTQIIKHLDADKIVGSLLEEQKYKFVDGRLLAEIVRDTINIIKEGKNA